MRPFRIFYACVAAMLIHMTQVVPAPPSSATTRIQPLLHAHAHNDYEHDRPLLDALDVGFTSIEADVFLVDGQLLVAHNSVDVSKARSLEALYLKPLQSRSQANNGRIYKEGPTVTLLVDIKTNGKAAYAALEDLLARYDDLVSITRNGKHTQKAVTVIVSGDRPKQEMLATKIRRAGIDGRLSDLDSDLPADLLPLISDKWSSHFRYRGVGPMPEAERKRLRNMVQQVHARDRRLRFWATPENTTLWNELKSAGVDLIGTDDLESLGTFLRAKS